MKRLTLLLLCITTLGLVSCQKDTIINQTTPNRTIVFDMAPNQWVLSNGEYFLDLNIPELDDINFYDEGVLVYTATPNFTSYYQLPYGDFDYEAHIGGISISCAYRPTTTIRVKVVLIAAENVT
ncbi:MAG: hypothetical protein REI64_14205 [Pedobacter sp.]|uniref:hypothetical protein n=1 Tax=Pedobacter sp. TaxID=1411316 RepID=UPI002809D95C|nr:hypothetical protein [Pedobacter sp.]MDQ8005952.1 hypothetical protein [Pedobacter sp.]